MRGAFDLCALRKRNRLRQVVPELPAPVIGWHTQNGARFSVWKNQPIPEIFPAHVHVGMKTRQLHVAKHLKGSIDTMVRITGRNLECSVARRQSQHTLLRRLLCKDESYSGT